MGAGVEVVSVLRVGFAVPEPRGLSSLGLKVVAAFPHLIEPDNTHNPRRAIRCEGREGRLS
ncbi:MAG: hypothetical protein CMM47_08310 [Rhodospirillaceae bacterium]|nr:hypothetical protein [Rhodospirillaceae bacterium]